jgi:hypothetical protein
MSPVKLVLFALLWVVIVYTLNCLIARKFIRVDPRQALLYFVTVGLIGLFGEIFLDSVYNFFVGNPLWRYNILPIHHAYTSSYAIVTWGIYGLHLYLLHGTLMKKWGINKQAYLALIFGFEALLLEAALTISAKLLLTKYMYYYYPSDLWHVSSLQNIPFYFICGLITLKTLERFKKDPIFFSAMSVALLFVIAFLT